jgi:hypothetical protein
MNDHLPSQIRDIHGIDPVSIWPLAPGWWLSAIALILVLLLLGRALRVLWRNPPGSWRREARRMLLDLRKRVPDQPEKQTAEELAQLLRRISLARFPREECAALSGHEWLEWLRERDPSHFNWPHYGRALIHLNYAPPQQAEGRTEYRLMIDAALNLLTNSEEDVTK